MIKNVNKYLGAVRDKKTRSSRPDDPQIGTPNSKLKIGWAALGIIFLVGLFGCGQEDTSKLSQTEDRLSKKTGREVLEEKLRQKGKAGSSEQKLSLKEFRKKEEPLKDELKMIQQEAGELGEADIDDYRLENRKRQLRAEALNIIEKSDAQFSEKEVNKLIRKYVDNPLISAREKKEEKAKFEKVLANFSKDVKKLLQSEIDWAEKEKEKEKLRDRVYDILEERWGPNFSSEEVDSYFKEYVEKPFEGAKQ